MLTTLTSYGNVPDHRQAEIMKSLGQPTKTDDLLNDPDVLKVIEDAIRAKRKRTDRLPPTESDC